MSRNVEFAGRILMVGFGSIGQGVLPLLLKHLSIGSERVSVIAADSAGVAVAREYGVQLAVTPLHPGNYESLLAPRLQAGDFLVNVSNDVSSFALVELCQRLGVLYVDTCIEPWAGGYVDDSRQPDERSNYALREEVLALRKDFRDGPTAVLTHGANPGLVSHFVKQALLDIAGDLGHAVPAPGFREGWAELARSLGVRVIHVAERDFQEAHPPKRPGEFVNTWSVEGFAGEGCQPAELGWGTHEAHFPEDGHTHGYGCRAAIYLNRPGAATRVRSWTPLAGPYHGFLITHSEAISIADYFTVSRAGEPVYRPTVHYAYHPCDDAVLSLHELGGRNWALQDQVRVVKSEIHSGLDELGVLLMGHERGAYWYGSRLTIQEARRQAPHNGATSLQVTAAVIAAVEWAIRHPRAGIVEPEDLPHDEILDFCRPYLGELASAYTDWTPLEGRNRLFTEAVDTADPWQFRNFRVD